jgi:hypothetical protein
VHQKLAACGVVTLADVMEESSGASSLSFNQKTVVALVLFGMIAVLAWQTMEPGKFRTLVFVVLGGLALRVLLGSRRPRYDE